MDIHLFNKLELNAKACITWRQGAHLWCRSQGESYMALYRLNNFYVEIHYHTSFDGITAIDTYTCEDQLQAYLDEIDINNLLA